MLEILKRFCSPDKHSPLCEPWSDGAYSYATNGYVMIRVPRCREIANEKIPFPSAKTIQLEPSFPGEWSALPEYQLPDPKECKTCKGSGKVDRCPECEGEGVLNFSTTYNDYEVECETCYGDGMKAGMEETCLTCTGTGKRSLHPVPVRFGDGDFDVNALLLEKIKDLPGVSLHTASTTGIFHFRFNGGVGVIMGLKR